MGKIGTVLRIEPAFDALVQGPRDLRGEQKSRAESRT